tara:strand:- start:46016 stop:47053 length:1038 start_codon:yes stop_codon:yes gene_type:complete
MNFTPPTDQRISRLIDANLDRAREGLRVIEDWCRFGLERKDLVLKIKDWRQQLGKHHLTIYKQARSASTDQGALLSHPYQESRHMPSNIVSANCSRTQEALRVVEEFTRQTDPELCKVSANIRFKVYELEETVLKNTTKKERLIKLLNCKLYLITSPKKELLKIVTSALDAGITMVQFRCKESNDLEKITQAKELASLCKRKNSLLIINDRIDIALAVDADGVHLGQNDLPTRYARELIGEDRLIGKSINERQQLKKAERDGCDYIGIGPTFPTKNKPHKKAIGINPVTEISKETNLPYYAIGGINISTTRELGSNGINRIAVSSGIIDALDPSSATHELLNELQ